MKFVLELISISFGGGAKELGTWMTPQHSKYIFRVATMPQSGVPAEDIEVAIVNDLDVSLILNTSGRIVNYNHSKNISG